MIKSPGFYKSCVLLFIAISATVVQAQTIENIRTRFDGERVFVIYDLTGSFSAEKFKVELYSSHDNFIFPLTYLSGAAGENILPGKGLEVVWDAKRSLPPDFDREIIIRIRATSMQAPPLVFEQLPKTVYKKGKTMTIAWRGGYPSDKVTLQLYQNSNAVVNLATNLTNTGLYSWKIPKSSKGKNYSFRIAEDTNPTKQAMSQSFRIKSGTSAAVIILPVLVVGGAVAFMGGDFID